jgi:glutathione S-transferase
MLLYDSPVSGNCYKVRLLLAHLGTDYERREVSVVDRSNRKELLGGLNPALRVPTLVLDDGRPLAESNAIIWYFGEPTPFVPDDRYERSQVLQWLFFEQYEHEPSIAVARFLLAYSGKPELFEPRREELQRAGHRALAAMERHLDGREYLVGDRLSPSRTSRSTPKRTWRTKAASIWTITRPYRGGSAVWRRRPGTCRSRLRSSNETKHGLPERAGRRAAASSVARIALLFALPASLHRTRPSRPVSA